MESVRAKRRKTLPSARRITASFFDRATSAVARGLLGKFLVRKKGRRVFAAMITETEAYDGFRDQASHAHRGKTPRNEVMFREAGRIYVYFTYGMHWMLNVVTGPKGYPAAVLIRGAVSNFRTPDVPELDGPGKLTKALTIDKKLNAKKLGRSAGLWIEDRGVTVKKSDIKRTPRIGIRYAGPVWSKKPYRFIYKYKSVDSLDEGDEGKVGVFFRVK